MGVDGHMLLRMLEPAIRPGPATDAARQPSLPLEQQSFESLLAQRLAADDKGQAGETSAASPSPVAGPLGQLARVDQIENASLMKLISQQRGPNASGDVSGQ